MTSSIWHDLQIAYYVGEGDWRDRAIRWATRSPYSHCELVLTYGKHSYARAISASLRDGGVRETQIDLSTGHWELQKIAHWARPEAWNVAERYLGARYDWKGILLAQTMSLHRHNDDDWFCSEICAHALGIRRAYTLCPKGLANAIAGRNHAFFKGLNTDSSLERI